MDESRLTLQTQALALRCLQALEELGSPDDPVWGSGESTLPLDVILGLTYETSRYRDWIQQSGAEGKGFINILSHEDMLHELLRFSLVKIAATILMLEGGDLEAVGTGWIKDGSLLVEIMSEAKQEQPESRGVSAIKLVERLGSVIDNLDSSVTIFNMEASLGGVGRLELFAIEENRTLARPYGRPESFEEAVPKETTLGEDTKTTNKDNMYLRRVGIVGSDSVRKVAWLSQMGFFETYDEAIGMNPRFYQKFELLLPGQLICHEITDISEQEELSEKETEWIRGLEAVYLCYSVTSRRSFDVVRGIYNRVRNAHRKRHLGSDVGKLMVVLVGIKIDNGERQVTTEEGRALSKELGIPFAESSGESQDEIIEVYTLAFGAMPEDARSEVKRQDMEYSISTEGYRKVLNSKIIVPADEGSDRDMEMSLAISRTIDELKGDDDDDDDGDDDDDDDIWDVNLRREGVSERSGDSGYVGDY